MNLGVHDFAIPHEAVQPVRDMVAIRIPRPPKMHGSIQLPDMFRDLAQYNVMAGRIVSLGPLAFTYKDHEGLKRQQAGIGDWVLIRPMAGTMVVGNKIHGAGSVRYVSSFGDIIGVIPADKMPNPDALLWDDEDEPAPQPAAAKAMEFGNGPRETVKINKG